MSVKIKSITHFACSLARVRERVRDAGPWWADSAEGPAAAGGATLVAKRGRGCGETFSGSPMRSGHVALSVSSFPIYPAGLFVIGACGTRRVRVLL